MVLTIINQTQNQRYYLSNTIILPANSVYTATALQIFPLSRDSGLVYDCLNGKVKLTDGANLYSGTDATTYLNQVASSLGSAVVGLIGSAIPSYVILVGGSDDNGNVAVGNFDNSNNLKTKDAATGITNSSFSGSAIVGGGVFNVSITPLSAGQIGSLQLDTNQNLLVKINTSLPSGSNTIGSVNNISGTISLPTGASTSANQTTIISSLQSIAAPIGSVGVGTAGTSSFLTGGVFNSFLPLLTSGQQIATQVDANGKLLISPLTTSSVIKCQLQDNNGTAIVLGQTTMSASIPVTLSSNQAAISVNIQDSNGNAIKAIQNQVFSRDVINIGGQYRNMSISTSAVQAKGGGSILSNRKMLIMRPTNGTVYWGFDTSVTTTTGMPILPWETVTLAVTDNVPIYVIAAGTVNLVVSEGS